jgi:hypothetical protein
MKEGTRAAKKKGREEGRTGIRDRRKDIKEGNQGPYDIGCVAEPRFQPLRTS